ncbi:unnamed protein product [Pleuronectes platessa]|uniref:Uncharacterized protein n=1 Tax=Pleuronectes platessa TaxID=8262 RepID=A0A9N7ZB60_PLEPL|nr:unnamed protein product [Pleuronectes platessa]
MHREQLVLYSCVGCATSSLQVALCSWSIAPRSIPSRSLLVMSSLRCSPLHQSLWRLIVHRRHRQRAQRSESEDDQKAQRRSPRLTPPIH